MALGQDTSIGAVTDPTQSSGMDWLSQLQTLGSLAVQLDQTHQLNQINLARAQKGLPPLSPSDYAPTVNVGVSSEVQKTAGIGLLAVLGVGLAVAWMFTRR